MIAQAPAAALRAAVEAGQSDAQIASELGISERTVRRALRALGVSRERKPPKGGPSYLLRFESPEERERLHASARAAGAADTASWLLELALEGPALAAVARDPRLPREERRFALSELFELLVGPVDPGPADISDE